MTRRRHGAQNRWPRAYALALVAALGPGGACASRGCSGPPGVTRARMQRELESTDKQVALAAAVLPQTFPPCVLLEVAPTVGRSVASSDASIGPLIEGGALALGAANRHWVAFFDRRLASVRVRGVEGGLHDWRVVEPVEELVEAGAPVLIPFSRGDEDGALAVLVTQERRGRAHHVAELRADGTIRALRRQPEPADDGFSIAAVATPQGALLAWDEEGPAGGVIVGQTVARAPADRSEESPQFQGPFALSEPTHDAAAPLLLARGAQVALVYLASRDVASESASQSAADIFVRALEPTGAPRGAAVRLTPGPALRFALAGLARSDALWIAYRISTDADHESSGDGGSVALLRVAPDGSRLLGEARVHTSPESMPTGTPAVLDDGPRGVVLVWAERRGEGAVTVRRPVGLDGIARGPARDEPAFNGLVPAAGTAREPWFVRTGRDGLPEAVRARCPEA